MTSGSVTRNTLAALAVGTVTLAFVVYAGSQAYGWYAEHAVPMATSEGSPSGVTEGNETNDDAEKTEPAGDDIDEDE